MAAQGAVPTDAVGQWQSDERTLNARVPHGSWLLCTAAAAVVVAITALKLPELLSLFAGGYHDDAVYLATARALAEGSGYSIASLPDSLPQTKYPVLFPALLALIWKVYPHFPDNLPLLRLVPWVAMWIWMWLLWKLIGEELGRREAAAWIILLMLAAPLTLYLGTHLLSETVFAALCTWAVLLMVRIGRGRDTVPIRDAVLLAVACALAFHTRTIGFTLLPAAAAAFWQRRRPGAALVFGLVWLGLCVPWLIWQSAHDVPLDATLAYYTKGNYASWNLLMGGVGALSGVLVTNFVALALVPAWLWNVPATFQIPWLLVAVMVLAAVGAFRMLRGDLAAPAVWLLATVAVVSLWTWPPLRFVLPVVPIYLLALAPRSLAQRSRWSVTLGRAIACALLLLAWSQYMPPSWHAGWWNRESTSRNEELEGREVLEGTAWVAQNTPPDAVIAANLDPIYWLYSGRQAIRAFAADPYDLFYAPGAPAGALGDEFTLRDLLLEHDVSYIVLEDLALFQERKPLRTQLEQFDRRWPNVLHEAWQSATGRVTIYSVDW
jgi:hypothetical protein